MEMEKPKLHLALPNLESLSAMFFNMTGRKPTEQELEQARKQLEAANDRTARQC